jgi:hypothetical protein
VRHRVERDRIDVVHGFVETRDVDTAVAAHAGLEFNRSSASATVLTSWGRPALRTGRSRRICSSNSRYRAKRCRELFTRNHRNSLRPRTSSPDHVQRLGADDSATESDSLA